MPDMFITKYDDVHLKVVSEPHVEQELSDHFTFKVPGYKFMPSYRSGVWSGDIKLYNTRNKLIYYGLLDDIKEFAKSRDYDVVEKDSFSSVEFSLQEAKEFLESLKLPITPRDYQLKAFISAVRNNRQLILSPTASGKSFLIYLLCRYYDMKTLIVVPTTTLIHQMNQDFQSYGYTDECHKIFSGREKDSNSQIFVSTWQSIYNMPKNWFDQFDLVIVDECHLAKANSLIKIMKNLTTCKYRFGFTGTLDGTQTNELVIKGLFGNINRVTTTSELIEQKHLADFKIKCLLLKYPDEVKKLVKEYSYPHEIEYIVTNNKRNKFIKNLALSLEGNTLVLFQFVEKHGVPLYDLIKNSTDRDVYFVHGGVDGEIRNSIRGEVEKASNAIIIASAQTFSTGINIKSLKNIIFASPSKSRVRTLQSIGRVLRKSETKTDSVLFDIADDLSWKKKFNYTLVHFMERLKIYGQEKFNYKIYNIEVK